MVLEAHHVFILEAARTAQQLRSVGPRRVSSSPPRPAYELGELGVADRSWLLMARAGPWERSKHAMCRMWHEWDGMQEVVAEQRAGTV